MGDLLYCFKCARLAIRITEIGADFKRVNVRAVTVGEGLEA